MPTVRRGSASSGGGAAPVDDSDLEDLLQKSRSATTRAEKQPLTAPLDVMSTNATRPVYRRVYRGPDISCTEMICAHLSYFCEAYPMINGCLALAFILCLMSVLANALFNPTEHFGELKHDYTNVHSKYDLSLGKIDHWCLKGDNDSCRCEDPLNPRSRGEFQSWKDAHKSNKRKVAEYMEESEQKSQVDVAFLGESLIEEMDGHWLGRSQTNELKTLENMFKERFQKKSGGMVEGVALGIAGDTSPNVLWRLLHGEMPDGFDPKVWWISLGMNDLARMQCSEEVVVLGILRVVEEILTKKPNARIVINSMLPMANLRGGAFPTSTDYRDAFDVGKKGAKTSDTRVSHHSPSSEVVERFKDLQAQKEELRKKWLADHQDKEARKNALREKFSSDVAAKAAQPAANKAEPAANKAEPAADKAEPAADKAEPATDKAEPAANKAEPAANKAEPAADKAEPAADKAEPATDKAEPAADKAEPAADKAEPAADKAEPAADKAEPDTKTAASAAEQPTSKEDGNSNRALGERGGGMTAEERKRARMQFHLDNANKKALRKRDPYNPTISASQHTIKKFKRGTVFTKQNRLPLWTSIYAINQELKKFCAHQGKNVMFFDATNFFAEREESFQYVLLSDRISVRGHPTTEGYGVWEDAILKKLQSILLEIARESPPEEDDEDDDEHYRNEDDDVTFFAKPETKTEKEFDDDDNVF